MVGFHNIIESSRLIEQTFRKREAALDFEQRTISGSKSLLGLFRHYESWLDPGFPPNRKCSVLGVPC